MSANKLEDHIKDLLQIVQATIEESRNLSDAQPFPGETIHFQSIFPNSHEEGVKSGFQSPRLCDLERELVDCQKMATFADLDAICGVNQQSTAITST